MARAPGRAGCPMLDKLDLVLHWFVDDVRPRMPESKALFCDEGGGPIHRGTVRNRLRYLLELEGAPPRRAVQPSRSAPCLRHP